MTTVVDRLEETKKLPSNVNSKEQLVLLPEEYLSNDPRRPLLFVDTNTSTTSNGKKNETNSNDADDATSTDTEETQQHQYQQFKYALRPMWYSVIFILIIECLERLTYYGINNTETAFLTGAYGTWSPNMSDVKASSYTSTSIAIAYTVPFIGGMVADGWLGFIKAVVSVFGAKQYHPICQRGLLEQYYVYFYLCINIGSLVGGIVVPLLCQVNLQAAYLVPVCSLGIGLCAYLLASKRYVRRPPERTALLNTLKVLGRSAIGKPVLKRSSSASQEDSNCNYGGAIMSEAFVKGVYRLVYVIPATCLVIPFTVAYSQMSTVFIIQGEAMASVGMIDAPIMTNLDPIFVLIMGTIVGSILYPYLSKRDISFPTTYKYALGTTFGMLAMFSSIFIDREIKSKYRNNDGAQISILWQSISYALVGAGEIFTLATVLDVSFAIAPKEQKGLASAMTLFFSLGVASFISIGLYNAASGWFPVQTSDDDDSSTSTSMTRTEAYVNAELDEYLWVLVGISALGMVINCLPFVKHFVERLKSESIEASLKSQSHHQEDNDKEQQQQQQQQEDDDDNCSQQEKVSLDGL